MIFRRFLILMLACTLAVRDDAGIRLASISYASTTESVDEMNDFTSLDEDGEDGEFDTSYSDDIPIPPEDQELPDLVEIETDTETDESRYIGSQRLDCGSIVQQLLFETEQLLSTSPIYSSPLVCLRI